MTEMTKSPLSGVGEGAAYIDRTVDKVLVGGLAFITSFEGGYLDGVLPILCDNLSLIAGTVCGLVRQLPLYRFQF